MTSCQGHSTPPLAAHSPGRCSYITKVESSAIVMSATTQVSAAIGEADICRQPDKAEWFVTFSKPRVGGGRIVQELLGKVLT